MADAPLPVSNDIVKLLHELSRVGVAPDNKYSLLVEHRKGVLILRVIGFLLQPIPLEFTNRFESLLVRHEITHVLIDLSKCTYMSSSVMAYLVKYFDLVTNQGHRIVMIRPNDKVVKVLQAIGLDSFFEFYESEQAALAALGK